MKKYILLPVFLTLCAFLFSETLTLNGITYAINDYSDEYYKIKRDIPKGEAIVCGLPTKEKNLVIPAKVEYKGNKYSVKEILYACGISIYAYGMAQNLETVTLEEGIEILGDFAFFSCRTLKKIYLPASCTQIGYRAIPIFDSGVSPSEMRRALEEINVAKGNPRFYSIDGILYDKKEKSLLAHPYQSPVKELIIPEGIEKIEGFLGGSGIVQKVVFPSTLKEMANTGSYFFNGCQNPPEIALPTALRLNYGENFFTAFGASVIPDPDRDFKEYILGSYGNKLSPLNLSEEDLAYFHSNSFYEEINNIDFETAKTLCNEYRQGKIQNPADIYKIALMYKNGIIFEKSEQAYSNYIKNIAGNRVDFAQAFLEAALIYKKAKDNWYAKQFIEKAIKLDQPEALYYYGKWLCNGESGFNQNIEKGKEYLKKAEELYLDKKIEYIRQQDDENLIIKICKELYAQGELEYGYKLALYYLSGDLAIRKDLQKAKTVYAELLPLLLEKINQNDKNAAQYKFYLGVIYADGLVVEQNAKKALELYLESADAGYGTALFQLGCYYYEGITVEKDLQKAISYFEKAALAGDSNSMNYLGLIYFQGADVEKDDVKAFEYFKRAAENGREVLKANLAYVYENGIGTKKDPVAALKYYEKAANEGNFTGLKEAANLYLYGNGTKKNVQKGFEYALDLALLGDAEFQRSVSFCYKDGNGVKADEKIAFEWMQKSAVQDDSLSLFFLGTLNLLGKGTSENVDKALQCFEKAISLGDTESYYFLGKVYSTDAYNHYNLTKAVEYFSKGVEHNKKDCSDELKILQKEKHFNLLQAKAVAISPDGTTFATGWDNIRLWNMKTGKLIKKYELENLSSVYSIDYSNDGKTIVVGGYYRGINIIDLKTGKIQAFYGENVDDVLFSKDGKSVYAGINSPCAVKFNASKGEILTTYRNSPYEGYLNCKIFISDDESKLLTVADTDHVTVSLFDEKSGTLQKEFTKEECGFFDSVETTVPNKDFSKLYYSSENKIFIYDMQSNQLENYFTSNLNIKGGMIKLFPDQTTVGIVEEDGSDIILLDTKTGSAYILYGHFDKILDFTVSADGKTLVSVSKDCSVRVWNLETKNCEFIINK
ncbi:MAG: leucine-rich repeat protein [Treponema sp.]|nr:leucine-rich repeat protein [Treponema sp.]